MKTDPVLKLLAKLRQPATMENYLVAYYSPDPIPDPLPAEVRQEAERALGALGDTPDDAQRTDVAADAAEPEPGSRTGKPVVRPVVRARVESGRRG